MAVAALPSLGDPLLPENRHPLTPHPVQTPHVSGHPAVAYRLLRGSCPFAHTPQQSISIPVGATRLTFCNQILWAPGTEPWRWAPHSHGDCRQTGAHERSKTCPEAKTASSSRKPRVSSREREAPHLGSPPVPASAPRLCPPLSSVASLPTGLIPRAGATIASSGAERRRWRQRCRA